MALNKELDIRPKKKINSYSETMFHVKIHHTDYIFFVELLILIFRLTLHRLYTESFAY